LPSRFRINDRSSLFACPTAVGTLRYWPVSATLRARVSCISNWPLNLGQDFSEQSTDPTASSPRQNREPRVAASPVVQASCICPRWLGAAASAASRARHRHRVQPVGEDVVGLSGDPDVIGLELLPTDACVTRASRSFACRSRTSAGNFIVDTFMSSGSPLVISSAIFCSSASHV